MKIAVDARELEGCRTGSGRVLIELLKRLEPDFLRRHKVFLYFKDPVPDMPGLDISRFYPVRLSSQLSASLDLLWEQVALPYYLFRHKIDVFLGSNGACPLMAPRRTKKFITVYDLTFYMDRRWYRPKERWVRQWRARISIDSADALVTCSEASARDIKRLLAKGSKPVEVLYPGSDHIPVFPGASGPDAGHRLLFVGSLLNRRPVEGLIRAVGLLSQVYADVRLTLIGDNRTYPLQDFAALIRELGLENKVYLRGYVPEDVLRSTYETADVFCFPSLYEGFGIPVVEAQRHGLPVVTLKNSALEEVGQDSVLYAGQGRAEDWAQAIGTLFSDRAVYGSMRQKGYLNATRFSWDLFVKKWLSMIETVKISK